MCNDNKQYLEKKGQIEEAISYIVDGMKADRTIFNAFYDCMQSYFRIKMISFSLKYNQYITADDQERLYKKRENEEITIKKKLGYVSCKYKELKGVPVVNVFLPWDKYDLRKILEKDIYPILEGVVERVKKNKGL